MLDAKEEKSRGMYQAVNENFELKDLRQPGLQTGDLEKLAALVETDWSLGAKWAGGSDEMPPEPLDAAIIFATLGDLVPMDRYIHEQNLAHYRKVLSETIDSTKRQTVSKLLADEMSDFSEIS